MLARLANLVVVSHTAVRIAYHYRREPLDALVDRVLSGPPLRRDPRALADTVERWLWLLPPRRMRPCLKRSLLRASLEARCGGSPRIHIGFRPGGEGHAWVTPGAPPPGEFTEIVSLP